MKCRHKKRLPYMAALIDAERRMKRGEKQRKCPVCLLWFWQSEFTNRREQ